MSNKDRVINLILDTYLLSPIVIHMYLFALQENPGVPRGNPKNYVITNLPRVQSISE